MKNRQAEEQTEIQSVRQTEKLMNVYVDRGTDRQTGLTDRKTDRQTEGLTERQKE
jgi:hypothetical protein